MNIGRKALAVASTVAAAAILSAPTASAATYQCGGWMCLYDNADGTGKFYEGIAQCNTLVNLGLKGMGDRASSFYNSSQRYVLLVNWTGSRWEVQRYVHPGSKGSLAGIGDNTVDAVSYGCGAFYYP